MMKFKVCFLLVFTLYVSSISLSGSGTSVTEENLKEILDNHPEALIFDIRTQTAYENGHLRGAVLLDSLQPPAEQQTKAQEILNARSIDKNYVIIAYCSCSAGGNANELEKYLVAKGYTNVYHLSTSFALWTDSKYVVTGSYPYGSSSMAYFSSTSIYSELSSDRTTIANSSSNSSIIANSSLKNSEVPGLTLLFTVAGLGIKFLNQRSKIKLEK